MYSIQDDQIQLTNWEIIAKLINDVEGLYKLAEIYAGQDNMEYASKLRNEARHIEQSLNWYDEHNNN